MTDVHDWHETFRLDAEQGEGDPFAAAVRATRMSMIVTDPRRADNPIVYANASFLRMTGYEADEVLGRNCRFLQGPETDQGTIARLRTAISENHDVSVDILNYRKDGSTFWNALYLSPVTGKGGTIQFFFASQVDITDRVETQADLARQRKSLEEEVQRRTQALEDALAAKTILVHEVDHRVKNNLQMVTAILEMQRRSIVDASAKSALSGALSRVEAIGTVHRRLHQSNDIASFDLADFIGDLARDVITASGRTNIKLDLDLQPAKMPSQQASPVALLVNEVLTNALKHAFPDERAGFVAFAMRQGGDKVTISLRDNGIGMAASRAPGSGFGSLLIRTLASQLNGVVDWSDAQPGTHVQISFPLKSEAGTDA